MDLKLIGLVGNNYFNDGWLRGALGFARREFPPDETTFNRDAWNEGYDMAKETGDMPLEVLVTMIQKGQVIATDF
jgi:hypothetical protein